VLDVAEDGSGTVAVDLRMDERLVAELDDLGLDPAAELSAVVAEDPDWRLQRQAEGEGLRLRAVREETDDPAGALAALSEGLADDDPALEFDLDIDVDEEGRVALSGTAELRTPTLPGAADADGEAIGPDAARLRTLMAEHVTAELQVTLPGRVVGHDADQVDGATMRWSLPPDASVQLRATSTPHVVPPEVLVVGGGALALAAAAGAVALALRRR
jgi:hypothetical protein